MRPLICTALALALALDLVGCATTPSALVTERDALLARAAKYDVEILRDTWGVPHIFGKTDADAAYGLAWAHAEDDFGTIEPVTAAMRGVLARAKGADAAVGDYLIQLLDVPAVVERGWAEMPPETRALAEAYADGINHYAALHPGEVTTPWLYPVTGQDVLAGFVFKAPLFYGLDRQLQELFRDARERPVSVIPPGPKGSNAIAVSRARSDDDTTRLFINSHQPWTGPVTWYEAHLVSEEGLDVYGGTFPGAPLILHGFNRDVGWAFTVNEPDLIDVFVLEQNPDDPNQYRHDGRWVDLEVKTATLAVNVLGLVLPVEREVLRSVHGPVVRRPHGLYALRYAGMSEHRNLEQWHRLNRAKGFDEWREAMRIGAIPSLNVVAADREGHVGYFYNAALPKRPPGHDYKHYLPGDDPRLVWTERYSFDELPQVVDPESGVVFNANHHPFRVTVGPGNPRPADFPLSVERRMTNRGRRLARLFAETEGPVSRARLIEIKHDKVYDENSIFGRARREALALTFDEPALVAAQAHLEAWDLTAEKDSRTAALGILTGYTYYKRRYDPTHEVDVERSFREAVDLLMTHYGRVDPTWGEVNRLRRGAVDLPLGGGPDVLRATTGVIDDDGRHRVIVGDSLVILVEWGPDGAVRAETIHQFGSATLDEESPHFADQAPLFADEVYKPVLLERAEIEAKLERRYRPGE